MFETRTFLCVLISICFTLIDYQIVNAQSSDPLSQFEASPDNTEFQKKVTDLVNQNLSDNPDLAISLAKEVLITAAKYPLFELQAKMLLYIGIAFDYKGMYDSAFNSYEQGLRIAENNNLELIRGDLYNNFSITKAIVGEMGAAINYAFKALAIFEAAEDSSRLAKIYNNLGSRYSEMDFKETALEYYLKATAINEARDDHYRLAKNYGNIGLLYYDLNNNESALEYFTKSLHLQDTLNNKKDYSIALHYLALAYERSGQYQKAFLLELNSDRIAIEINDELGRIPPLRGMAKIKRKIGEPQAALSYLLQSESLAKKVKARSYLIDIYEELAETYAVLNNFQKAFIYNSLCNSLRDSIQSIEKSKAVNLVQQFEKDKKQHEIKLLTKDSEIQKLNVKRQKAIRNSVGIVGILLMVLVLGIFHRYRYIRKTNNELEEKNHIINLEKDKSDQLLLNILPAQTAEELKTIGSTAAKHFDMVTVMFTDFKGFTSLAETLSAQELVDEIDFCYRNFDRIITNHNIEKIKTIGDSYMCAGGLPIPNTTNPTDVVKAAIEIQRFMADHKSQKIASGKPSFELRIGIHTGPVIAGVVGIKKYQYDIWGDTVNIASRMESSGEVGKVNISQFTFDLVKDQFNCIYRGKVQAKNKGEIDMYFVELP